MMKYIPIFIFFLVVVVGHVIVQAKNVQEKSKQNNPQVGRFPRKEDDGNALEFKSVHDKGPQKTVRLPDKKDKKTVGNQVLYRQEMPNNQQKKTNGKQNKKSMKTSKREGHSEQIKVPKMSVAVHKYKIILFLCNILKMFNLQNLPFIRDLCACKNASLSTTTTEGKPKTTTASSALVTSSSSFKETINGATSISQSHITKPASSEGTKTTGATSSTTDMSIRTASTHQPTNPATTISNTASTTQMTIPATINSTISTTAKTNPATTISSMTSTTQMTIPTTTTSSAASTTQPTNPATTTSSTATTQTSKSTTETSTTITTETPTTVTTETPTITAETPTITTEAPTITTEAPTNTTETPTTVTTETPTTVTTETPTTMTTTRDPRIKDVFYSDSGSLRSMFNCLTGGGAKIISAVYGNAASCPPQDVTANLTLLNGVQILNMNLSTFTMGNICPKTANRCTTQFYCDTNVTYPTGVSKRAYGHGFSVSQGCGTGKKYLTISLKYVQPFCTVNATVDVASAIGTNLLVFKANFSASAGTEDPPGCKSAFVNMFAILDYKCG